MGLFSSIRISSSALSAQRLRMDTIAHNVANAETTKGEDGGPYRRQSVIFREADQSSFARFQNQLGVQGSRDSNRSVGAGVQVSGIHKDTSAPRRVHDPAHPDADADGYVLLPNVNVVSEMTDLVGATRAYEASITVLNATKALAQSALSLGRGR